MGLLTPGDRSTWDLYPDVLKPHARVRAHMAALIENMELHRTVPQAEISLDAEPYPAPEDDGGVIESAA